MSRATLAPLAAVLGLVLAASAAGGATQNTPPVAEAAGGDAVPGDPSIVAIRIARAEAALGQAGVAEDANDRAGMLAAVKAARLNAARALNAARYLVKTAPPTPVGDGLADGAPVGIAYGGPEATLFSVLILQHDVAATAIGLMTAKGAKTATLRKAWASAVLDSFAQRNKTIAFIHARKANAPTFATLMPGLLTMFKDELKEINGRLKMNKFGPNLRASLANGATRVKNSRTLVKKYWPPTPAG